MDKEKSITKEYWKIVWGKIKERAWKESDMRGYLIGFFRYSCVWGYSFSFV